MSSTDTERPLARICWIMVDSASPGGSSISTNDTNESNTRSSSM